MRHGGRHGGWGRGNGVHAFVDAQWVCTVRWCGLWSMDRSAIAASGGYAVLQVRRVKTGVGCREWKCVCLLTRVKKVIGLRELSNSETKLIYSAAKERSPALAPGLLVTRTAGWGCVGRAYKPDHMITGSVGARTPAC